MDILECIFYGVLGFCFLSAVFSFIFSWFCYPIGMTYFIVAISCIVGAFYLLGLIIKKIIKR